MRNISDKSLQKIKETFCVYIFLIVPFMSYVEKCCRAREATDDIQRCAGNMQCTCRLTNTHS